MLGTEPDIIANYVETGKIQIVFWPVLNHGDASLYATLASECVGQQSPEMFWEMHGYLFQNQRDLWGADRDYFVQAATAVGADEAAFTTCYDGPEGLATVMALDSLRRDRGIYAQPTFVINGNLLAGSRAYDAFAQAFDNLARP